MLTLKEQSRKYSIYKDFCIYDDVPLFSVTGTRMQLRSEEKAATHCLKCNFRSDMFQLLKGRGFATIHIHQTRMFQLIQSSVLDLAYQAGADIREGFGYVQIKFSDLDDYDYGCEIIDKLLDNQVVCFEIK